MEDISKNTRQLALGIIVGIIFLLPIIPHVLSKEARLRFTEVNIFSDLSIIQTSNDRMAYDDNSVVGKIFHNRRIGFIRSYLNHFFDHFEPGFLFIRGDGNPKFSIQDVGQLYFVEMPFLILGMYFLFAKEKRIAALLFIWLVAAIIPAATARETPHALRIENSLPTWQVFVAYGILSVISHLPRSSGQESSARRKILLILSITILLLVNIGYYLSNYYSHYAKEYSGEWQYGYREAIRFIQPMKDNYDSVVFTESIGRPYMYALFYEKYDPRAFWRTKDSTFDAAGFYHVYGFDKYRFTQTMPEIKKKTLYILNPYEVPGGARVFATVRLLNGNPILVIFDMP